MGLGSGCHLTEFQGGGGGFTADDISSLFAGGSNTEGFWPTDVASGLVFSDDAKTTNATENDDVLRIGDYFAAATDLVDENTPPHYRATTGLVDVNTGSTSPFMATETWSGSADHYVAFIYLHAPDQTRGGFLADLNAEGTRFIWFRDGTTDPVINGFTATLLVDGVDVSALNTNALWDLVAAKSGKMVVECYGDFSSFLGLQLGGRSSAYNESGEFGDWVIMENPGDTGRTDIRTFLANKHSITI